MGCSMHSVHHVSHRVNMSMPEQRKKLIESHAKIMVKMIVLSTGNDPRENSWP